MRLLFSRVGFSVTVIAEKFTECGYDTKECAHEAGYDAYLTGRCFIAMSNFLGMHLKTFSSVKFLRYAPLDF